MKKQARFTKRSLLLTLALVGVISLGGWYVWGRDKTDSQQTPTNQNADKQPESGNKTEQEKQQLSPQEGLIKGDASYPSEHLPEDLEICAVNVRDDSQVHCIKVGHLKAPDLGYELKVPAGTYYVYSKTAKRGENYRAYYNEFVTCGLSVTCPESSHKAFIPVEVTAGSAVDNINPSDWYDMSQN